MFAEYEDQHFQLQDKVDKLKTRFSLNEKKLITQLTINKELILKCGKLEEQIRELQNDLLAED